ncbi:MAG: PadR family transcriptional regulator [Thermoanaerobaculia bacterium]|nr:PadR family transcriptional regulator [Thermoanaerobaculia bacterium]
MSDTRAGLLQGTLDMLVLRALALEPMHGWGLAQRIGAMSRGVFELQQGTLYPALQRLKRKGWVRSEWRRTENNRRARYYSITPAGTRRLAEERSEWERTSAAVESVLRWEGDPA